MKFSVCVESQWVEINSEKLFLFPRKLHYKDTKKDSPSELIGTHCDRGSALNP